MKQQRLVFDAAILFILCLIPTPISAQVQVKEELVGIPTYLVGNPELDPYFFTGRTYQGAAGHVYPYPIYDVLTDERVDRDYKYVTIETNAEARALEALMSQDGYVDSELKIRRD